MTAMDAMGRLVRWGLAQPILRAGLGRKRLIATACRKAGAASLEDWAYRDGFELLLRSLAEEAALNDLGRWWLRRTVLGALVTRLRLVAHRRTHAEVPPLAPPVIITGLPRTGTTFLHRLLAEDERFFAPPLWRMAQPLGGNLERWRLKAELFLSLPFLSGLDAAHFVRAEEPEECMFLMAESFCSMLFWVQAPVYGYLDWYRAADKSERYRDYADLLRILAAAAPGRRLLLKAPEHLGAVDLLTKFVPGAVIVQTHREPATAFASFASLLRKTHAMVTDRPDPQRTARATLDWLSGEARRNLAARPGMRNVLDVGYGRLVGDPLAAAAAIYERAGLVLDDATREKFRRFIAANPQGKRGAHRYAAADTGLTGDEIAGAFQEYGAAYTFV
jgi:hypothetical protein